MFKKAVFLAVLILALSFGSAFAYQIDSVSSSAGPAAPTALFVNPGGLGDVLLYGYYNVRGGQDQFFTITNTSAVSGARVRIRFREAATIESQCNGSQEVLDFDICLSAGDMWTGRISGSTGEGVLTSTDTDTTVQTSGSAADAATVTGTRGIFPTLYPNGVAFKSGSNNTVTDITEDNTREGYFEVIAERGLDENCTPGVDCTCGNLRDVGGQDVGNMLMGHTYMVNLGSMEAYGAVATPIANFSNTDITFGIQSGAPTLQNCLPDCLLAVFAGQPAITPVNYALTKSNLEGIYDIETAFGGNTSWVVTFPTKWATHDEAACGGSDTNDIFDDPTVVITIWDDKENQDTPSECEFSPCPETPGNSLPNEVNVINIQNSSIFTSDVTRTLEFRTATFDFGWIDINMLLGIGVDPTDHVTIYNGQATFGLPAIGYQAMKFVGGRATGMLPLQYKAIAGIPVNQ